MPNNGKNRLNSPSEWELFIGCTFWLLWKALQDIIGQNIDYTSKDDMLNLSLGNVMLLV